EIRLQPGPGSDRRGIELLALDKGPGIANVGESMRDGVSSSGTPGTGLGAIARMADFHDLYSHPAHGTAVLARFWSDPAGTARVRRIAVGGLSVARAGERVCGDDWTLVRRADGLSLMVADGLGHGPDAAEAAREATRVFRGRALDGPAAALQMTHDALRSTRGAAAALGDIDDARGVVTYSGGGNSAGAVLAGGTRRDLMRTFSEFTYPWPGDALMVLPSDGLVLHWTLEAYPGLAGRDASLVAGVLYPEFRPRRARR